MGKQIICADALAWLDSDACPPCSIITSPPDANELDDMPAPEFARWYRRAIDLCIYAAAGPVIIYCTDRKTGGQWLSKAGIIIEAAQAVGWRLLWHKIVLRRGPGLIDIHRPGYSHLIAIGGAGIKPGQASPDVMERGRMLYPNGMGMIPARLAITFAARAGLPIIDPFCGMGTVPALALALGLDSIGVDIDPIQCAHAQNLFLPMERERAG